MFSLNNQNQSHEVDTSRFTCPITLDIMEDPVRASDGMDYERSAIEHYFSTSGSNAKSLKTLQLFTNHSLVANNELKNEIAAWRQQQSGAATSVITTSPEPLVVSTLADLQPSSADFENAFKEKRWWKRQVKLWNEASIAAQQVAAPVQTSASLEALTVSLNNMEALVDHQNARMKLVQGATAHPALLRHALRARDEELVKLLCFHLRIFIRASDYEFAIKNRNNNISFLNWMLEVMNLSSTIPPEAFFKVQSMSANIRDAGFMRSILERTGTSFGCTIDIAIQVKNNLILPVLFEFSYSRATPIQTLPREKREQLERLWTELISTAFRVKNDVGLSIIMNALPENINLSSDLYSQAFCPATFNQLRTANVSLPQDDGFYLKLLQNFTQEYNSIRDATVGDGRCQLLVAVICLLPAITMITCGAIYLSPKAKDFDKIYTDDCHTDDYGNENYSCGLRKAHAKNRKDSGDALITIGACLFLFFCCALANRLLYCRKYYEPEAKRRRLQQNCLEAIQLLVEATNIPFSETALAYVRDNNLPAQMLERCAEIYRNTHNLNPQPNNEPAQSIYAWCCVWSRQSYAPIVLVNSPGAATEISMV